MEIKSSRSIQERISLNENRLVESPQCRHFNYRGRSVEGGEKDRKKRIKKKTTSGGKQSIYIFQ